MSYFRRISTRRLLALCAGVLVVAVATAAIALAATSGGPTPPPKPLPKAVHDALAAPEVAGISARIEFTNHLLTSDNVQGSDPLLTGGSGRLWATPDGQLRLELQSDSARGDSEVVLNGRRFLIYSGDSNRAYRGRLPRESGKPGGGHSKAIPSVTRIRRALARLGAHLDLSGATPTDVAGRPAYRVRVSPKSHGGLLGGAALAWDAVHGTPLEAAVYARGSSSPVLELKVTDISFGAVSSSVFDIAPAPGTKVDDLGTLSRSHGSSHDAHKEVSGSSAVASKLDFRLHAPSALAGMHRQEVRLIRGEKSNGAVVTYGHGLDGLAVVQYPAAHGSGQAGKASGSRGELTLPKVSIGGASADELQTPLGTVLHFKRGGVEYVVAGSVPRGAAEAAARGL